VTVEWSFDDGYIQGSIGIGNCATASSGEKLRYQRPGGYENEEQGKFATKRRHPAENIKEFFASPVH